MPPCGHNLCARQPKWWQRGRTGAVLDGQWYCSQACLEAVFLERLTGIRMPVEAAPRLPGVRLGALLRHQRVCPPEQIAAALEAQAGSRLRLGEQLRAMGAVEPHTLLRALADQAGVSYLPAVDPAKVLDAPGGLTLDTIQALRLVPISAPDADRVRVAFPAPVPRAALTAFRQQTGWTPEPFLVGDDVWLALLEHYGASSQARARSADAALTFAREHDALRAVRRLAEVVVTERTASLHEVRWGQYAWVRLRGQARSFDLLFDQAGVPAQEEESWQAATTSR